MESKLPKPSGLKRPTPVLKNILPMDRIKMSKVSNLSNSIAALSSTYQPLTKDLTNLPNTYAFGARKGVGRAASPEVQRVSSVPARAKLRRSRSACDLRDMRPTLKRTEITLAPIPAKSARINFNSFATATSGKTSAPAATVGHVQSSQSAAASRAGRLANTTTATKRPPSATKSNAPSVGRLMNKITATKKESVPTSSLTSVSSTGAGKIISKRIPPYDFKARYNDLLEKHKVLKEKYETKCEQMGNLENMPEQLEESQSALFSTQEQLKNVQIEAECLHRQVLSQSQQIDSISTCLGETKNQLESLQNEHTTLKTEHSALSVEVLELRQKTDILTKENTNLKEELECCKEQLFRSNIERKELHNAVMDLRGNIRVFCRVRPSLELEHSRLLCVWNYIDEATLEIQNPELLGKYKAGQHTFSFDQVFHPGTTQEEIFELVSPLIQSALDGYNVCIFAYGQTGSGKTYTMDGTTSNAGVIPRTVDLLFDSIQSYKRLGWEYTIKVSFLEIYNEVLYDLLSNEQKEMEIRMAKSNKNDIYVSNITEETVDTAGRLSHLMQMAKMNRATAATVGNERSSRSHAVTKIQLLGRHAGKNEMSIGTINLVDLAGSESPKTSTRMTETKNINRSLSELTNVILALLQKQDHIPYRNSKLTHLLMPSLGGNSKTLMFINVAPFLDCFTESVKSLRFAASVNSCKMAKAKRNRQLNTSYNSNGAKDSF